MSRKVQVDRPVDRPVERRRITTETFEGPDAGELVTEEISPAVAAGFQKLKQLLGEQAVKCMIRRRSEETKKWDFQDTIPVEEFSFELVRDVYGGGEYQVQALDESGDYVKTFSFHVDKRYQGSKWAAQEPTLGLGGGNGHGGLGTEVAVLMRQMVDELKGLKAAPVTAAVDPMAMIEKLASTMKALTPAPVAAMAPASFKDEIDRATSIITLGKTLMGEGGGGGDSGDGYMSAISKLSEPIVELVKVRAQQEAARLPRRLVPGPVPVAVPAPAVRNVVTAPAPVAALAEGGEMWLLELQKWLPLIAGRARKGLSAESTAFFVVDELSELTQVKLAEILAQEGALDQLGALLPPELQARPVWVQEFVATVQDILLGTEDPEAEEPRRGSPEEAMEPDVTEPRDLAAEAEHKLSLLTSKDDAETGPTNP